MIRRLSLSKLWLNFFVFAFIGFHTFANKFQDFIDATDINVKCRMADELAQDYLLTNIDSLGLIGKKLLVFSNKDISPKGIAYSHFILGEYYVRTGKESRGVELFRESNNYFVSVKDYNMSTRVLNAIGVAYHYTGTYNEACKWFKKSLEYGKLTSDESIAKVALLNLAQTYKELGEYGLALDIAEEYKDWLLKINFRNFISNAYAVIGSIYLEMNQYEKATFYFEQCYRFAEELQDPIWKANAYTNIGIVQFLKKDLIKSEEFFFKALEIRKNIKNVPSVCDGYLNYGGILFEQNKYKEAIFSYQEGLTLAKKNKKYMNEIELLDALKEVYLILGKESDLKTIDKELEIATNNQKKVDKEISSLDKILTQELNESERIQKRGFVDDGQKKIFYIGVIFLFVFFFFLILFKKLN